MKGDIRYLDLNNGVFNVREPLFFQIYHDGKLVYYIDGHDENNASWMRYIRCARHRGEQNMFAFQYYGNIYYRAFKDLPPGTELLVWYDDKYPQHMGIPLEIRETFHPSPVGKKRELAAWAVCLATSKELFCSAKTDLFGASLRVREFLNLVNGTVVGRNQIPMLRHTLQMGVDFEEGGNRSARRKPFLIFGSRFHAFTSTFHSSFHSKVTAKFKTKTYG